MLSVYICDDNHVFLREFVELVKNQITIENYDMQLQFYTDDPYELLLRIKDEQNTGIYFLDIDLQTEINGLSLAQEIRGLDPRGYIVFVTTHAEMTLLTFEYKVEAMDYIIKDTGALPEKIGVCLSHINERHSVAVPQSKVFSLNIGDKVIVEDYANIYLFEVSSTIHKVIMVAENRQVEFYGSLAGVQERLDNRFMRCSNSLIVNADKITEIHKRRRVAVLSNGEECAISVRNMREVLLRLSSDVHPHPR